MIVQKTINCCVHLCKRAFPLHFIPEDSRTGLPCARLGDKYRISRTSVHSLILFNVSWKNRCVVGLSFQFTLLPRRLSIVPIYVLSAKRDDNSRTAKEVLTNIKQQAFRTNRKTPPSSLSLFRPYHIPLQTFPTLRMISGMTHSRIEA